MLHLTSHTQEEAQEEASSKFQEVAEAYEILSNEGTKTASYFRNFNYLIKYLCYVETRGRYDRGEDVSGNAQNQQQHNPFQHFQQGGQTFHFQWG